MIFQINTIIDKITTLKDNALKITLTTQEINGEDTKVLFDLANKVAWVAIKETPMSEDEIEVPEITQEFKNEKSPSQVQRNIIYRIWERTKQEQTFPDFYKSYMFKINEKLKDKLN